MEFPIRINKYLAEQGLTTRRGADDLIESGKVFVNGAPAVLGQKINADDRVELQNHKAKTYTYLLYYKPRGVITHSPNEHETDIATATKKQYGDLAVFPVGRLDKDSEGLMLLTDDGRVTGRLLEPKAGHEKEYLVAVDKRVTGHFLKQLENGVSIEGYLTKSARAQKHPTNEKAFTLTLTEGKKHQIRRMCAALGYQVQSLKRIRIADLELGKLKPGQIKKLNTSESAHLRELLGLTT